MGEKTRLNKYLAALGIASRREIDRLAEAGGITVNGVKATPGILVGSDDVILVKGVAVDHGPRRKVYYMLNKPPFVISSAADLRGRTIVTDLAPKEERIFPVGRLDYETTGLLLLTNDGALSQKLLHPKNEIYKEYIARIPGRLTRDDIFLLEQGMVLDDGMTLPARVRVLLEDEGTSLVSISIREGRKRQVRRMFRQLKKPLMSLKRERIGELSLGDLPEGACRPLTREEVNYLYSL